MSIEDQILRLRRAGGAATCLDRKAEEIGENLEPQAESDQPPTPPAAPKPLEFFEGDYVPGFRIRVSGLSSRGRGDGRSRATVQHAILIKDMTGSLKRKAGQILCVPYTGWGQKDCLDGEVECQSCQAKIRRHKLVRCVDPEIRGRVDSY